MQKDKGQEGYGSGGAGGDRTPDLDIANVALSRLSYGPTRRVLSFTGGASLNVRSTARKRRGTVAASPSWIYVTSPSSFGY